MTATSTDPRAARFAATLTSVVLAAVLVTPAPVAVVLLAWQTAVFAVGAGLGPTRTPYAVLFRVALRPRLGPPTQTEAAAPQRFAQTVGLAFAATGLVLTLAGAATAGLVAVGLALVAALLNAVVGLCLGCEMYLALRRLRPHAP